MNGLQYHAAFVIRFDANADIESGRIEGRVEHVASYRTKRFHCVEELLSFVGRVLEEVRAEDKGQSQVAECNGRLTVPDEV
jgi:hypothetical protein